MKNSKKNKGTIILGITGSISAYRMCDLSLDLKEEGVEVIPILSKDAQHFVTPLAIQSLAGREVHTDFFSLPGHSKPIHIELARAADVIVVAPATADIIARMRMGLADTLLSCTLLAAESPVLVVPAMNTRMYEHHATQENLNVIQERGVRVLPPVEGKLVCSELGVGHIAPNEEILKAILSLLEKRKK